MLETSPTGAARPLHVTGDSEASQFYGRAALVLLTLRAEANQCREDNMFSEAGKGKCAVRFVDHLHRHLPGCSKFSL